MQMLLCLLLVSIALVHSLSLTDDLFLWGSSATDAIVNTTIVAVADLYYRNLTLVSGGKIYLQNNRLLVSGYLDLIFADPAAITINVTAGGDAIGSSPGATRYSNTAGSIAIQPAVTPNTVTGTTGVGSPGISNGKAMNGGIGGEAGAGGASGTGKAGGATVPINTPPRYQPQLRWVSDFSWPGSSGFTGGGPGNSGSNGGGSSGSLAGAGGQGGQGGGVIYIATNGIVVDPTTTPAGTISIPGAPGGKGGNGSGVNSGGGGGAGGGGGGYCWLSYLSRIGGTVSNMFELTGGNGAPGGNGVGLGLGGDGGGSGSGGRVTIIDLGNGISFDSDLTSSAGSGSIAVGSSGGMGSSATPAFVDF